MPLMNRLIDMTRAVASDVRGLSMEPHIAWGFTKGPQGWQVNRDDTTNWFTTQIVDGRARLTRGQTYLVIRSPVFEPIRGADNPEITFRIRTSVGRSVTCNGYFEDANNQFSSTTRFQFKTRATTAWQYITVNVAEQNAAWKNSSTIRRIRLDNFGLYAADEYVEIEFVAIGRPGPGATTGRIISVADKYIADNHGVWAGKHHQDADKRNDGFLFVGDDTRGVSLVATESTFSGFSIAVRRRPDSINPPFGQAQASGFRSDVGYMGVLSYSSASAYSPSGQLLGNDDSQSRLVLGYGGPSADSVKPALVALATRITDEARTYSSGVGVDRGLWFVPFNAYEQLGQYVSIGKAETNKRFLEVHTINGVTQTSDARLKTEPRDLTESEVEAAIAIAQLPMMWKWLQEVEVKGEENAYTHIGPTAQAVVHELEQRGLDWRKYAFIQYTSWEGRDEVVRVYPAVVNASGVEVEPERREVLEPAMSAGDLYSLVKDELALFILAGMARKLGSIL